MEAQVPVISQQVVPRWNLEHAFVQRPGLMAAAGDRIPYRLGIPSGRHAGRKQRLYLGCEIERLIVECIEQRLDAEAVARGEQLPLLRIPQNECKLAPQTV